MLYVLITALVIGLFLAWRVGPGKTREALIGYPAAALVLHVLSTYSPALAYIALVVIIALAVLATQGFHHKNGY